MSVGRTVLLYAALGLGLCTCFSPSATAQNYAEHFGISIGAPVYQGQVTFTEQVANDLNQMGVRWIRVEFIAYGDTMNYTQYDEIINRANAHDIEVMGLLTYQTKWWSSTSQWADDAWQDSFRDRCVEVVDHYKDFPSGGIKFWEVWNEPDSLGGMPAEKFARMLSICYPAIKAADPEATIISGGLTGFSTPTYSYLRSAYRSTYFEDYEAANGIYPFDILGQHPYHWTWDPDDYLAYYMTYSLSTRRLMGLYGDDYKRIWLTEYGWNSSPTASSSVNPGGNESYNEQLQADYFEDAIAIAQPLEYTSGDYGPFIEKTFLFCYKDFDLGTPETREFFGTVRQDYDRKPLFYRYEQLTDGALQNAALTATVSASGEIPPYETAQHACDATPFTKWASLTPVDDHTLVLELDGWYEVHEFRLAHAEMGHEPDTFNTASFEIQSSLNGSDPWVTEVAVTNTNREPVNALPLGTPKVMRHIRLHVTDAGIADGVVRLPEFEVWGVPADAPPDIATDFELGLDVDSLTYAVSNDDLIHEQIAAFEGGVVDFQNGVFAHAFSSGECLEVFTDQPIDSFWLGYGDPSPSAHMPVFTDGTGASGVVLRDFAQAAAVLRYDFEGPEELHEIRVFAANAGMDGRIFQNYDAYVSTDGGTTYEPLSMGVKTGQYGDTNPGLYGASVTRIHPYAASVIAEAVTNLRLVFYATSIGDTFFDPWQGNENEPTTYQDACPDTDARDVDGYRKAFTAPILVEIDVFGRSRGDGNGDGIVDAADAVLMLDCITGPDNGPLTTNCSWFDFSQRDDDVDLADVATFQEAMHQ